jgi:hypothetical protein
MWTLVMLAFSAGRQRAACDASNLSVLEKPKESGAR